MQCLRPPASWLVFALALVGCDRGVFRDTPIANIEVEPRAVAFGEPALGVPALRNVTIRNNGTRALTVTSLEVVESDSIREIAADPVGAIKRQVDAGIQFDITLTLINVDGQADSGKLVIASDDPDEPLIEVPLVSELVGEPVLGTCVMTGGELFANCADPEIVDWGSLAYDATPSREISVFNAGTGNRPLRVNDVFVTNFTGHTGLFETAFFRLVADAAGTGIVEQELTAFPVWLPVDDGVGPPAVLLVRLSHHAVLDGAPVPAEMLAIDSDDAAVPRHGIPFAGDVGCPPGIWNLDAAPGCEYPCDITNNANEVCDGKDNDCNGGTDDGVAPGLCLICSASGAEVPGNDDNDCGVIDCSGYYAKAGTAGATSIETCHAHEPITANRCAGALACVAANSSTCAGQPLLAAPQASCGKCVYVGGCAGNVPGQCAPYIAGTPTGLCTGCDGAGGESALTDDAGCGSIDCSGWYAVVGVEGPTDTNSCHGHEPLTVSRCEGMADCKDANTADCDAQPLSPASLVSCGLCKRVVGCAGATPGGCENYSAGTGTRVCAECDGAGGEVASGDDSACGSIDCSGWYAVVGVEGPTDTNSCYGREPLTVNRCEGMADCKDANTTDCAAQPFVLTPQVICGLCKRVVGCAGTTPGACESYSAGTRTRVCAECDGAGGEVASVDDAVCGIIDCSGWYIKTGTPSPTGVESCFGHASMTAARCEGAANCKDANTTDCAGQAALASPDISCGLCRHMTGCIGATPGTCADYPLGTPTSGTCGTGVCRRDVGCDGKGAETCTPGAITGDDSDCDGLDDNCNGPADENYASFLCGVGACRNASVCIAGSATCTPLAPEPLDDPDDLFIDTNCDGIDGDASIAFFVATNGSDSDPGTMLAPFLTVQHGIDVASAGQHVYVSSGVYNEALTLENGVSVYGGFSRQAGWTRSFSHLTVISNAVPTAGRLVAMSGANLTASTTIADFTVITAAAPVGVSNYGFYCNTCTALSVHGLSISAGRGGSGSDGLAGATGANGGNGLGGGGGSCDGGRGLGGGGGSSSCSRGGGAGGHGGAQGCNNGLRGADGVANTLGGAGGTFGESNCFGGGDSSGNDGGGGNTGLAGGNGSNGAGGGGGSVLGGFWSTNAGLVGVNGGLGNGGGGGGGGGAQCGPCVNDGGGNGGGGGGGGGCGGTLGTGGTGGGGSFGMFLVNSTGITLTASIISSSGGGDGAAGALGGLGGGGGNGAAGAAVCPSEVGRGGNGGNGGAGGRGGAGGGGAGGPSYAVYRSGTTLNPAGNALSFGAGGFGGASSGNAGASGASGATN